MNLRSSALARHRLRRLAAAPAVLATLLALAVPTASAAAATGTPRIAATSAAPGAGASTTTTDASPLTFTMAPAGGGTVTPGQPVTVSVAAQSTSTAPEPAGVVRLSLSARPLVTRAEVRAWLRDSPAASRTELTVAQDDLPVVAPLSVATAALTIDPATLSAFAPGVYPLRADYTSGEGVLTASSVLIVPGAAAAGALGVVVPIMAPPISTGLLTATELTALTAPGGDLRVQLDAVTGTAATLAIDPAVVAAIRRLGVSAPRSAIQWLGDLLALPNARFALQFGDADLAVQVAAGISSPLAVSTLAPYLSASDFPDVTPTSAPTSTSSGDGTAADAATAPAPTPTPGGVSLPDLAALTDIGAGAGALFWPATGTAGGEVAAALGALRPGEAPSVTLIDSTALSTDTTDASSSAGNAVPAWAAAGTAQVLVYDADASAALAAAAQSDLSIPRAAALAAASAYAALAGAAAPQAPLLVAVDRTADRSAAGLRAAVQAASHLGGRAATDLTTLTSGAPAAVTLASVPGNADQVAELTALLGDERDLTDFATILGDPSVLTAPERASLLQLLGNGWRGRPSEAQVAYTDHRAQTQQTLDAVAVVPPSDITLAATSAPLTFTVHNDLAWPVSLRLDATPNDTRLIVQDATQVEAGPAQNTRVRVPVQARVASGESTIRLQLRSSTGVAVGGVVPVNVAVRAEWESVGLIVGSILVGVLLVVGVIRTARRVRRRSRDVKADADNTEQKEDADG